MTRRPMLAALALALGLLVAAPHMARAQNSRSETATSVQRDARYRGGPEAPDPTELSPAGGGERLDLLGDAVFRLGGDDAGVPDAGIDAGPDPPDAGDGVDAGIGPDAALPAPAERGGCSVTGAPPLDGAACALLFFAGLLWRRRDDPSGP